MRQFISLDPHTQQIIGYFSVQIQMKQANYIIIINFQKDNHIIFMHDLATFLHLIFTKYKAESLTFKVRKDHPLISRYKSLCLKYFNTSPKNIDNVVYTEWTILKQDWLNFTTKHFKRIFKNDFNI